MLVAQNIVEGNSSERAALVIAETAHLTLRRTTLADAAFLCRLLSDPDWLRNIGDRGVRTIEDAEQFVRNKLWKAYETDGFGMYTVETQTDRRPAGICGIVRRPSLPGPDLGFALLPEFRGRGFALEAASAVMDYARDVLHLPPLLAITTPDNERSGRLLVKLGFEFQRLVRLTPDGGEVKLYAAAS